MKFMSPERMQKWKFSIVDRLCIDRTLSLSLFLDKDGGVLLFPWICEYEPEISVKTSTIWSSHYVDPFELCNDRVVRQRLR